MILFRIIVVLGCLITSGCSSSGKKQQNIDQSNTNRYVYGPWHKKINVSRDTFYRLVNNETINRRLSSKAILSGRRNSIAAPDNITL